MSDLISRYSVIESIKECAQAAHDNHEWDMEQGYLNAIEIIEEESSLMVPIKDKCCICPHCSNCDVNDDGEISSAELVGHWVRIDDAWKCDQCGEPCASEIMGEPRDRFCKWCGARMEGADDEAD